MNELSERWAKAGRAVVAARETLGMSQADLVRRSGVSDPIVRRIENGVVANYRAASLSGIEAALGWPPDTIRQMVNGPRRATRMPKPDEVAALRQRVDELQAQLVALSSRVADLGALQQQSSRRSGRESPGSR